MILPVDPYFISIKPIYVDMNELMFVRPQRYIQRLLSRNTECKHNFVYEENSTLHGLESVQTNIYW